MNFNELMLERQSCRGYLTTAVESEKLTKVLETAALSPSARNSQPWNVAVCTGKTKEKVAKACQMNDRNLFLTDAPVLIVISQVGGAFVKGDESVAKSYDRRPIDVGIYCHALTLAAAEQGLGTCIIGWLDEKAIQKAIGSTDEVELVVSLGYPSDKTIRPKNRKPLAETTKFFD